MQSSMLKNRIIGTIISFLAAAVPVAAQLSLTPAPQVFSKITSGFPGAAVGDEAVGTAVATGDFNSDGFNDLAVGVPGEDIGAIQSAGVVYVLYGAASGLSTNNIQTWAQNSPGIEDQAEEGDQFGRTLAAGDFNGDGFDDLAIGVDMENVGTESDAGAVHVLYGAPGGLTATGSQLWSQESSGIDGVGEAGDQFGFSLTAGDFNGDGFDDLAVGVAGENNGSTENSGAVNVIYGTSSGLASAGNQLWQQSSTGIEGDVEELDFFGFSLAAGDFNNDGFQDLAVGAPGQDVGGDNMAGAVHVISGSSGGLTGEGSQYYTQDTSGITEVSDPNDNFGYSLAAGDFNGDGFDDLAISVRGEEIGSAAAAGALHVLFGSSGGVSAAGDQFWSLDSTGVPGIATAQDRLGTVLAAHDFDNDGFDDLVAGTPEGDVGDIQNAGFLLVLYGRPAGLASTGSQLWTTDDLGATSNTGDFYGSSVAVADFNGDGFADVAAGSPGDDILAEENAGSVTVIYGNRPPAAADDLQRMLRGLRQQNGRLGGLEEQLP